MRRYIYILLLMTISLSSFSESKMDSIIRVTNQKELFDTEKVIRDMDTISHEMDTTFQSIKKLGNLLSKEVKMIGLKKTIQINHEIFIPIVVILILYLVWLKNRK